jgi:hypothetical protein
MMYRIRVGMSIVGVTLLTLLAACSSQPSDDSTAKDVTIIDNGHVLNDFSMLKGTLYYAHGWIVYDGTSSEHGSTVQKMNRKLAQWQLEQKLQNDLRGTPYQSRVDDFIRKIVNDEKSWVVDVVQQTVKLPDGTLLEQRDAEAQIAISTVKAIVADGVTDSQR